MHGELLCAIREQTLSLVPLICQPFFTYRKGCASIYRIELLVRYRDYYLIAYIIIQKSFKTDPDTHPSRSFAFIR